MKPPMQWDMLALIQGTQFIKDYKKDWVSLLAQMVKNPPCTAGDLGSIPGLGRSPVEGNGLPPPIVLPGKSHGQRNLVGYGPWGHKESDTTEQLTL